MKQYLILLAKRAERAYLRARIILERPDLFGKPFIVQVRTYTLDTIKAHAEANPGGTDTELPELVYRAMEIEVDRSAGYYRAQAQLFKYLHEEASYQQSETSVEHSLSMIETSEVRALLKEAIDQLTAIKFTANRQN